MYELLFAGCAGRGLGLKDLVLTLAVIR